MLITESCVAKPSLDPLDEADTALVKALGANPRVTGRELAGALGRSEASVSRRLARLLSDGVIRFHGFVPPHLLGCHSVATLYIDTKSDPTATGKRLTDLPYLHFVATVAGQSQVIAFIVSRTDEVTTMRIDRGIASLPDVVAVRTAPMMHHYTPHPMSGALEPPVPAVRPRRERVKLDAIDRAMIAAAQRDGRATHAALAQAGGLSPAAAADRFQGFLASGMMTIIACTAPARFGRLVTAIYRVSVHGPIATAAEEIGRLTGAAYVVIAGGEWQVSVEVDLRDEAELESTAARIRRLACVGAVQTLPFRAVPKDTYDWGAARE